MPNIFTEVESLELKQDDYVIVGGGVLVALQLIGWDEDIDICVAPIIYEEFKRHGWKEEKWQDKNVLKKDIYDIGTSFGKWSLFDLQSDALWIKEIPFISLGKLREWKSSMGREKDIEHIKLIDQYLYRDMNGY
jgi:hypothetical protein